MIIKAYAFNEHENTGWFGGLPIEMVLQVLALRGSFKAR